MAATTIEQTAIMLAQSHAGQEQDTIEIYLAPHESEIRLIEVAEDVGTTNEILPFHFNPQPEKGVPYPLYIVMVSPDEMRSIQNNTRDLPKGWGPVAELRLIFERNG